MWLKGSKCEVFERDVFYVAGSGSYRLDRAPSDARDPPIIVVVAARR